MGNRDNFLNKVYCKLTKTLGLNECTKISEVQINKTTTTYPLKKIYEIQPAAGHWDDSWNQKWGGQLLSGLPDFHFPSDHKRHRFTLGYVSHQIQIREELHWGTHFPRAKSHSVGIKSCEPRNMVPMITYSSFMPGQEVNAVAWKWLPTFYISGAPGYSACPAWFFSLPFNSRNTFISLHLSLFIGFSCVGSSFLSWLTLVSATCKQNTLTVKAATQIYATRRRWAEERKSIKSNHLILLIYCTRKDRED